MAKPGGELEGAEGCQRLTLHLHQHGWDAAVGTWQTKVICQPCPTNPLQRELRERQGRHFRTYCKGYGSGRAPARHSPLRAPPCRLFPETISSRDDVGELGMGAEGNLAFIQINWRFLNSATLAGAAV